MGYKIVLEDQVFSSLEDFGRNMYLYPDASEKLLTSTKFLSFLAKEDRNKFDKLIQVNHAIKEADVFLFYAQYIFCPHMELKHHGYCFNNLEELGKKIISFGPEIDVYLKDFLKFKLLSKYMREQRIDAQDPILFNKVLSLEKKFKENENKAYFLLGFTLSKCNTIVYEKESFDDVEEFLSRMTTDFHITKFSQDLERTQYVYAWLEVKGYEKIVNNYRSLVNTIEQLEKETYDRINK